MTTVKKRNGKVENFNQDKVRKSISKAAIDADYDINDIAVLIDTITNDIMKIASEKNQINSNAIRDNILNELDKVESSIADSWRRFDEKYKV